MAESGFDFNHVIEHVGYSNQIELLTYKVPLPAIDLPLVGRFQVTRFMVMEVVAAVLCMLVFIPLARRARRARPLRGKFGNFFEGMFAFIREEVAHKSIGHDGDRFVPYLCTVFVFILSCNLLGMVPFGASATASLSVTATLALFTFVAIHGGGIRQMGLAPYVKSMVPHVPTVLWPLMLLIELIGHCTKTLALTIRLFANMFAGHVVLAVILSLIVMAGNYSGWLNLVAGPPSVLMIVGLSLLEIFVAFLQAFIFTFLSAIFIGMALHPHH